MSSRQCALPEAIFEVQQTRYREIARGISAPQDETRKAQICRYIRFGVDREDARPGPSRPTAGVMPGSRGNGSPRHSPRLFLRIIYAANRFPAGRVEYHLVGKISLSEGLLRSIPFDQHGSFKLQ